MPDSWKDSLIALIPKQGTDNLLINNYRPITLLNNEYKLYANILAERSKKVFQMMIHNDQAGFLPGRHIYSNTRNIINLLAYLDLRIEKKAVLMAIDAEKAFDRVSWKFMKGLLHHMDFGIQYIKGIEAI